MNSNRGVFTASVWLPVIFMESQNALAFNQLDPPPPYRSLGVGVGIGIGLGLGTKSVPKNRCADARGFDEVDQEEHRSMDSSVLRFAGLITCECPVWGLSTSAQAPQAYDGAPGVLPGCGGPDTPGRHGIPR